MSVSMRIVVALTLSLSSLMQASGISPATRPSDITLPNEWVGRMVGSEEGNPYLDQGKPLWRLDHLWPDDWRSAKNFKPMPWGRKQWQLDSKADGVQQRRPIALLEDHELVLSLFAAIYGGPPPLTNKSVALVMVAPGKGVYSVNMTVAVTEAPTAGKLKLLILRHGKGSPEVVKLTEIVLSEDAKTDSTDLADVQVELDDGEELLFLPQLDAARQGATIRIGKVAIKTVK